MSTSITSTFVVASPSTFLFLHERPASGYEATQSPRSSHKECGVRELSRQQWESLKPLIQRVYIDDDKPFPYLAQILRSEHGFEPTANEKTRKRQFSRKIAEWGFRKNVPRSERYNILQTLASSTHISELKDRRLKPSKLKNWQRRYKDQGSVVSSPPTQDLEMEETFSDGSDVRVVRSDERARQDAESRPMTTDASSFQDTSAVSDSRSEYCDEIGCELCQDSWPFDWSTVDVPGSPGLTRLFKALEIESSTPEEELSLEVSGTEMQCWLSDYDMRQMFNEGNKRLSTEFQHSITFQGPNERLPTRSSRNPSPQYPWRDIEAVFFGYSASPLTEIYVFQPAQKDARRVKVPTVTMWESLDEEEGQVEATLGKLKQQFQVYHPAVIALMENLSDVYYRHNKDKKAEQLLRILVDIQGRTLGPLHLRTLQTSQKLINTLVGQGQYVQAQALHNTLRSAILESVHPEHILAIHAMEVQALLSGALGDYERDENLHREALQIRLTTYGPRDKQTLLSMARLGLTLGLRGRSEGEQLLRTVVQLHLEDAKGIEGDVCRVMANLAAICWMQNGHEDGCKLASTALERFSLILGPEHPETLQAKAALARNMSKAGDLSESERIFREVVAAETNFGSETKSLGLSNTTVGLAEVLVMQGCYEEATEWYQVIFEAELDGYGPEHQYTQHTCHLLGDCYLHQGRYRDGLDLYRRMVEELRRRGNSTHPYIPELESWIEWFAGQILDSEEVDTVVFDEAQIIQRNEEYLIMGDEGTWRIDYGPF